MGIAAVYGRGTRYGWTCSRCVNGRGALCHTDPIYDVREHAEEGAARHNALYHGAVTRDADRDLREMREWIADCAPSAHAADAAAEWNAAEVRAFVARQYVGGVAQFRRDGGAS